MYRSNNVIRLKSYDIVGTIHRINYDSTSGFNKAVQGEFNKLRKSIVYIVYQSSKDKSAVINHKKSAAHVVWMPYYSPYYSYGN